MSVQNSGDIKQGLLPTADVNTSQMPKWWESIKVFVLIFVWYALSLGFNVYNKKTLKLIDIPWTLSLVQLMCGLFIFGPLWATGMRKLPKLTMPVILSMFPLGCFHALCHMAGVVGMGAGAVSMFQILKAAEPLFTAFLSIIIVGKFFRWYVYATMVPIIVGVGYSSLGGSGEAINMLSVTGAMMSNLGSALRGIYSKVFMNKRKQRYAEDPEQEDDNLTPSNMYAMITIWAILITFPFCIWFELTEMATIWSDATQEEVSSSDLLMNGIGSGVFYYVYNEVAFITLNNIHQVTHAIANTMKRVILIIATAIILVEPPTINFIIGSTIGISGVLLYSLAKQKNARDDAKDAGQ